MSAINREWQAIKFNCNSFPANVGEWVQFSVEKEDDRYNLDDTLWNPEIIDPKQRFLVIFKQNALFLSEECTLVDVDGKPYQFSSDQFRSPYGGIFRTVTRESVERLHDPDKIMKVYLKAQDHLRDLNIKFQQVILTTREFGHGSLTLGELTDRPVEDISTEERITLMKLADRLKNLEYLDRAQISVEKAQILEILKTIPNTEKGQQLIITEAFSASDSDSENDDPCNKYADAERKTVDS